MQVPKVEQKAVPMQVPKVEQKIAGNPAYRYAPRHEHSDHDIPVKFHRETPHVVVRGPKPINTRANYLIGSFGFNDYTVGVYKSLYDRGTIKNYTIDMAHVNPDISYRFKLDFDSLSQLAETFECSTSSTISHAKHSDPENCTFNVFTNGEITTCTWFQGYRAPISRTFDKYQFNTMIHRVCEEISDGGIM